MSEQLKEFLNISEKDWLNLTNRQQVSAFFTHKKNIQEGQGFKGLTNRFPWSHLYQQVSKLISSFTNDY